MTTVEMIRLLGAEFSTVEDAVLEQWIAFATPMVSKKQFGRLYQQALACLICHKLKMAGYGADSSTAGSDVSVSRTDNSIASISAGSYSISYNNSAGADAIATDAEYGKTIYGMQFLQLRRSVIVPIHISGQGC